MGFEKLTKTHAYAMNNKNKSYTAARVRNDEMDSVSRPTVRFRFRIFKGQSDAECRKREFKILINRNKKESTNEDSKKKRNFVSFFSIEIFLNTSSIIILILWII